MTFWHEPERYLWIDDPLHWPLIWNPGCDEQSHAVLIRVKNVIYAALLVGEVRGSFETPLHWQLLGGDDRTFGLNEVDEWCETSWNVVEASMSISDATTFQKIVGELTDIQSNAKAIANEKVKVRMLDDICYAIECAALGQMEHCKRELSAICDDLASERIYASIHGSARLSADLKEALGCYRSDDIRRGTEILTKVSRQIWESLGFGYCRDIISQLGRRLPPPIGA